MLRLIDFPEDRTLKFVPLNPVSRNQVEVHCYNERKYICDKGCKLCELDFIPTRYYCLCIYDIRSKVPGYMLIEGIRTLGSLLPQMLAYPIESVDEYYNVIFQNERYDLTIESSGDISEKKIENYKREIDEKGLAACDLLVGSAFVQVDECC